MQGSDSKVIKIYGMISVAARDLDGSVLAVSIKSCGGEDFLIDDTKMGNELLRFVGAVLQIAGTVRLDGHLKILKVTCLYQQMEEVVDTNPHVVRF